MLRLLAFFLFALFSLPALADISVKNVRIGTPATGLTRFVLELEGKVDYRLFFLSNPERVVLDLPTLTWPEGQDTAGAGLVKGWRYGQFGQGTRLVLDLSSPAALETVLELPERDGRGPRLAIDLKASSPEDFRQLIGRSWGQRGQQTLAMASAPSSITDLTTAAEAADETPAAPPVLTAATSGGPALRPPPLPDVRRNFDPRPLVVIDAGHGGVDPGAIGVTGVREKDITLSVARQLAARLEESGHYRVALTRSRDIFIPLQERVAIARRKSADLFISLHADSAESREAQGGTIYTLSERASDREAARLADSENRADQLAGLELVAGDDNLASMLTSMSYAASMNSSRDFSALLSSEMGRQLRMTERSQRSAGFAVLKAPDMPSVLIEMGYLSNRGEARLLAQPAHQRKIVAAVEQAVQKFFLRHSSTFEAQLIMSRPD